MISLVVEGYHYILNGDGSEELYDIENDPSEKSNLGPLGRNLAQSDESRQLLEKFRRSLKTTLARR